MTLTANVSVFLAVVMVVLLSYRSQAHHVDHGDLADTVEEEIEFVRAIFKKFDADESGVLPDELRAMADKGTKSRNFLSVSVFLHASRFQQTHGLSRVFSRP